MTYKVFGGTLSLTQSVSLDPVMYNSIVFEILQS